MPREYYTDDGGHITQNIHSSYDLAALIPKLQRPGYEFAPVKVT